MCSKHTHTQCVFCKEMKISTIANIDSRHFQANVLIYLSLFQLYLRIDLIKSTKDKRTNYTKLWKNDHRKSKNERQKDREREKKLCVLLLLGTYCEHNWMAKKTNKEETWGLLAHFLIFVHAIFHAFVFLSLHSLWFFSISQCSVFLSGRY